MELPQAIGTSLAERVLDTIDPSDSHGSLERAHYTLTGEHATAQELIEQSEQHVAEYKRLQTLDEQQIFYGQAAETAESGVAIRALVSIFTQGKFPYSALLNDWPIYQDMHTHHIQPHEQATPNRPRNALAAGVMTALSAAAFTALAEDVFCSKPYLVDPRASAAKRRHGNFYQLNALALPSEWSNTMTIGLSCRLLRMILDEEGKEATGKEQLRVTRRLLDEMLRVTEPGGHLLMIETPPGFDMQDTSCKTAKNQDLLAAFDAEMPQLLHNAGYTNVASETCWQLPGVQYLFDPSRNFAQYERIPIPRSRIIYARKPLASG